MPASLWTLFFASAAWGAPSSVLLLGNSYTQFNHLDQRLVEVLDAAAPTLDGPTAQKLVAGGLRLPDHVARIHPTTGQPAWQDAFADGAAWDAVVLQDQSQVPGFPESEPYWQDSRDAAVALDGYAAGVGAETTLLLTWGRRDGDSINPEMYPDFSTMQARLTAGYRGYADAIAAAAGGGPVWIAPVGPAFAHIHDAVAAAGDDPTTPGSRFAALYDGDGSHPSQQGSVLAACVLASTLTGWPTTGAALPGDLPADALLGLQAASDAVVVDDPFGDWAWPWARAWSEAAVGDAEVSIGDPALRLQVRTEGAVEADALALSDAVVWVQHDAVLGAVTRRAGDTSGLVVDGGALTLTTAQTGARVRSGALAFTGDTPSLGGDLDLEAAGIWQVDASRPVAVDGGGALAGALALEAPLDAETQVVAATFRVEPTLDGLRVTPDGHEAWVTSDVDDAGPLWTLWVARSGEGTDGTSGSDGTGGTDGTDGTDAANADGGDTGEAAESARQTAGSNQPGGCGGGAALLLLAPLAGWRRRSQRA